MLFEVNGVLDADVEVLDADRVMIDDVVPLDTDETVLETWDETEEAAIVAAEGV